MRTYYDAITEFIFAEDAPGKADVIFVPGGNYPDAAEHAAGLWLQGLSPLICVSGRYSKAAGCFDGDSRFETECDYLTSVLRSCGVPGEAIIPERKATFTWENAIFSRRELEKRGISAGKAILSCQNWHARRCLMYYQQQFPQTQFLVSPVSTRGITRDNWMLDREKTDIVLGEVERCGAQFHEILHHLAEGNRFCTPDDWSSPFGQTGVTDEQTHRDRP